MDKDQFVERLKCRISEAGSQEKLANLIGFSDTYVSEVRRGKREPSELFCQALGFRKVVIYEEIDHADS